MFELLKHNLIAGWRNILKYKVQNTISVFSLSIGVLFFAITLYFVNIVWNSAIKDPFKNNHIEIGLADKQNKTDNGVEIEVPFTYEMIEKIQHLPNVERILYKQDFHGKKFKITDKNGKSSDRQIFCSVVYPDFLKDNNFRSAITGKKIDTLKPGTLVITRNASKNWFGEDENPVGSTIKTDEGTIIKISDVVYSTTYYGEKYCMYLVPDSHLGKTFGISKILPVIKEGNVEDVLPSVINDIFPEYKCKITGYAYSGGSVILILFLLVGGSILVTGLAGFLKMQLQLFVLRSREMALRRCNGAKPSQLFQLLCSELFIIFFVIATVSVILSVVIISNYGVPALEKWGISENLEFEPAFIYQTELWIVLFAYLASIVIAWLSVRKTLKAPLADTVGKSSSQRTFWNKTMQVVQYATAISVIAIITIPFVEWQREKSNRYDLGVGVEYYKKCAVIPTSKIAEFDQQILNSSFIRQKTHIAQVYFKNLIKEDSTSSCIMRHNPTDDTNGYLGIVTNIETFLMFQNEIVEKPDFANMYVFNPDYEKGKNYDIFVQPKEANAIRKTLNIKFKGSDELFTLPDGNKYIRIGYTSNLPHIIANHNQNSFYIIKDFKQFINEIRYNQTESQDSLESHDKEFNILGNQWIVLPTDWDDFAKDVESIYHKNVSNISPNTNINVQSAYDLWFKEYILIKSLMQLMIIIVVMCLICVVLTVYSSISLETRGKQKEVAIRKVNGAKTRDIVKLFSRYYIITLTISFFLAAFVAFMVYAILFMHSGPSYKAEFVLTAIMSFVTGIVLVSLVTLFTVWQKIYKISHINPSELIKKE